MKNKFLTKVLVAVAGSTSFILAFNFLPVWFTAALATLVAVLTFYELAFAANLVRTKALRVIGFTVSALIPWMIYFRIGYMWMFFLIFASLIAAFLSLVFTKRFNSFDEVTGLFISESVFQISISLMIPLLKASAGVAVIIMAYITAWGTDAIAQLVGRKIGKHKFVPDISPNKSLEGSVSGIIGNAAAIALYAFILQKMGYAVPMAALIIFGSVAGIMGEIGDLFFSYIKRASGIKDFGSFIKGHGGVLDRFDSVIFVLPIWYAFICNFTIIK